MHVGAIGGDEQQDERVIRSRPLAAMGTAAGRRGGEVVVDPPLDGRPQSFWKRCWRLFNLPNLFKMPKRDIFNILNILDSVRDCCVAIDLRKSLSPSVHG